MKQSVLSRQVGLAISGKMAYLSFVGGLQVTNGNVAFSGVAQSID
jgi:predicted ATP-dependent serine protease